MKEIELRELIREEIRIALSENTFNEELLAEELLEEGKLANWALAGLMTLASVAGIGQTSRPGNEQDIKNAEKISLMLKSNPEQFKKMLDQADFKIDDDNLQKLKKVDAEDIRVITTTSPKLVKSKLKSGKFAISGIETKTDTIKPIKKGTPIVTKSSIDLKYGGQTFKTGTFDLNENIKENLKNTIDSILSMNGKITRIYIESSTDQQRMPSFVSKSDPTGNITLAQKRSESISDYVKTLTDVQPTVQNNPNSIEGGITVDQFKQADVKAKETGDTSELDSLKKQSQVDRYNLVKIDFTIDQPAPDNDTSIDKIIEKNYYTLIYKSTGTKSAQGGTTGGFSFKGGKGSIKCKGISVDGSAVQCPAFK